MDRPRRDSRQHNGITLRGLSQPTFATKSAEHELHHTSLYHAGLHADRTKERWWRWPREREPIDQPSSRSLREMHLHWSQRKIEAALNRAVLGKSATCCICLPHWRHSQLQAPIISRPTTAIEVFIFRTDVFRTDQ